MTANLAFAAPDLPARYDAMCRAIDADDKEWRVPEMRGFVYFFLKPVSGTVKVGFSTDPDRRLRQIQTGCDETLQCIGIFEGGRSLERHIHNLLKQQHVRGEWFVLTERLRGFLMERLREEANAKLRHADALEAFGQSMPGKAA